MDGGDRSLSTQHHAVVSGGSGAVGDRVVGRLLARGHHVTVLDRVPAPRHDVESVLVDLADLDELRASIDALLAERGAPSVLVISHGWSPKAPDGGTLTDPAVTAELFEAVLRTNLTSAFLILQAFVPAMAARGRGHVVAIGSAAARTGRTAASAPYVASKAGLTALVRTFAVRYGPDGVLVNDVTPGKIANPSWGDSADAVSEYVRSVPVGRLADADEVAEAVAFLVSTQNTYITGQSLVIDGGRLA